MNELLRGTLAILAGLAVAITGQARSLQVEVYPLAKGAGFELVMTQALPTLDKNQDGMFARMAR